MNKALKPLLALIFIFIVGGVVIYMDQTGAFGSSGTSNNGGGGNSNDGGYGTLGQ